MSTYRILYLRGGLLDGTEEVATDDLVAVTRTACATRPHLTAEIWRDGRKVAVVHPCKQHRFKL